MLDATLPGRLAWYAETNEAAKLLLKREHPGAPNLGDITVPDFAGTYVDLLTSGDPCQSMSAAGRQLASDDERFLWWDVERVIDRIRPQEIFLENVQNIVSVPLVKGGERGGVLRLRLDSLRERGYAVRWTVLGACAVGAPHHRHRWFLRAWYVGTNAPEAIHLTNKCGAPRSGGRHLLPTPNARDGGDRGTPTQEHALRRVANPERSVNLEDAVVAYLLPTPTTRDTKGRNQRDDGLRTAVTLLPTPVARDGDGRGEGTPEYWANRWATRPDRATNGIPLGAAVALHWGRFAEAIATWERVIGRPAPDPTEPAPKGGRRLNAALSEWMMGMPEGHVTRDATRNDALRLAGNGVVPLQAQAAWNLLAW